MDHPLGEVPGVAVGATFANRRVLAQAGVHRHTMMGISWSTGMPAESVVISGGYEDDQDWGDVILYTGMGGSNSGTQVKDQTLTAGNMALMKSLELRTPVRVVRGAKAAGPFAPDRGLRYEGLFRVTDAFFERGRSGCRVWRFVLTKLEVVPLVPAVSRVQLALIDLYSGHCQLCGGTTRRRSGTSAMAVHVRPPTLPHRGPDTWANLICACPTHALEFEAGTVSIRPDLHVIGGPWKLRLHPKHALDKAELLYRAERYSTVGIG